MENYDVEIYIYIYLNIPPSGGPMLETSREI